MKAEQSDIISIIDEFKLKYTLSENHRYTSFDYCYNYFSHTDKTDIVNDIEKSCLALGFYLASWGMFRGSSFLLNKSLKHYEKTIEYIGSLPKNIWQIDVDKYDEQNIKTIIEIYNQIKERLIINNSSDLTLVTKVQLGVFGFIPAFDQYFCDTFRDIYKGKCGFRKVNINSLTCIKEFYDLNKTIIDNIAKETFTTNFQTTNKTTINYTKAKIIDMYGFTKRRGNTKEYIS